MKNNDLLIKKKDLPAEKGKHKIVGKVLCLKKNDVT